MLTFVTALAIPFVALAHNPFGYAVSIGLTFIISLVISLVFTKKISKSIHIKNKYARIMLLLLIELALLSLVTIILIYPVGILIYIAIFGG